MRKTIEMALLVLVASGCNKEPGKARDRFLEALQRDDFKAAYAELHPDAKVTVPNEAALREQVEKGGLRITKWGFSCAAGGLTEERLGSNFSSEARSRGVAPAPRPFELGARIDWRQKCNGPLLVTTKKDGETWKVTALGYR